MKKQFQQWVKISLFFWGCVNPLLAQHDNRTQVLESFNVLEINAGVAVKLIKCKPKQERVVCETNLSEKEQPFFQLNKGKLSIQTPPKVQKITVYYAQLDALVVNATQAQLVTTKPIKNRFISITLNGSGNVAIPCKVSEAHITVNGSGQVDFALQTKQCTITINGSATAVLKGKAQSQHITLNGSGEVQAGGLKAKSGVVTLNGSGIVEVRTKQKLMATLNGSGQIYQKGAGKTVESLNGSGSIHTNPNH